MGRHEGERKRQRHAGMLTCINTSANERKARLVSYGVTQTQGPHKT